MQARLPRSFITCGIAGSVVATALLFPSALTVPTADAASPPATITLTGIVRDFPKTHPDFNIVPTDGPGHYAGNHAEWLSSGTQRPIFTGGGFKVGDQWQDSAGRNIAPHLNRVRGGVGDGTVFGVRVNGKIDMDDFCEIDAFDSSRGPYGALGNYGPGAYVATNSIDDNQIKVDKKAAIWGDVRVGPGGSPGTVIEKKGVISGSMESLSEAYPMPHLVPPNNDGDYDDLEDTEGDVTISIDTTLTGFIPSDPDDIDDTKALQYDQLKIDSGAILTIEGDLRIVCQKFEMKEDAAIILAADANLTMFVTDDHDLKIDKSSINNYLVEGSTTAVTINYLGDKKVEIKESVVYGTITCPDGKLEIDKGHLCGGFMGEELKLDNMGYVHVDKANAGMGVWNPAILVREKIEIDEAQLDSFDSNDGPYDGPPADGGGGTNWGQDALLITNAVKDDKVKIKKVDVLGDIVTGYESDPSEVIKLEDGGTISGTTASLVAPVAIPVVTPPDLGLPKGDDLEYSKTTATISSNMRVKKLKLDEAIVWISGDVTIQIDDKLEMQKSQIQLLPDAKLTLYVMKDIKIEDMSEVNTVVANPQLLSIRRMSLGKKAKVEIKKRSKVVAWIQGAKTELKLDDKAEFFGSFAGEKVVIKNDSVQHVDMAYLITCVDSDDTDGTSLLDSNGMISSGVTFDEWFKNDSAVNAYKPHQITLADDGTGVYEYLDSSFYPVEGILKGNEGDLHNNYFTYSIHAKFTYSECAGQFIEFAGGDGAWAFVNWKMVLDLGTISSKTTQYVDLDRLGLQDGKEYHFHIFYAHRNAARADYNLRTNLVMSTDGILPANEATYD